MFKADHVSGGRQLAQLAGADYCLHESADVGFDFSSLKGDQELDLGNVSIRVLHTPGHTPEHAGTIRVTYLTIDVNEGEE
jgi:glyoxylase-like metal-dependent hydrolase (beta-lactamase superfamily II)